jgi:antitoxin (DNA-binding transcriptional repressor) of toxin-antitoxin stability system
MAAVTIDELSRQADDVIERAAGGERITITRSGKTVAELHAVRPPLSARALLDRWRRLPALDPFRGPDEL